MNKKVVVLTILVVVFGVGLGACNRSLSTPPSGEDAGVELNTAQQTVAAGHRRSAEETAQALLEPTATATPTPDPLPYKLYLPHISAQGEETPESEQAATISDVDSTHPYYETIEFVVESGAVALKDSCVNTVASGNVFCPQDYVLRRELLMSICTAIYDEESLRNPTGTWDDQELVRANWGGWESGNPSESWYVARCGEQLLRDGYISGFSNNRYLLFPQRRVDFGQYWVFFERGVHGGNFWEPPEATGLYDNCPVGPDFWYSKWCETYINEDHHDLSSGPPTPLKPITRVELARAVEQYLKNQAQ